jgi:hypothetical protein
MEPHTKLLHEAATKTFTAAEKLRFRAMGAELAECYRTLSDYDGSKLAAQLESAHAGHDTTGAKLPDMDSRLAQVADCQRRIAESAARIADARERERGLFNEAKSPASRLLQSAIAKADALLQNPPPCPTPPPLLEWGIDINLAAHFCAVIAGAKQTLCADLADKYSQRGAPEVGFHILTRGGLTEEK